MALVPAAQMPELTKYFFIGHVFGFLGPLFARISFCLYMLRVLGVASLTRKMSVWAIIALQVMVNITIVTVTLSQCGSFHNLWKDGFAPDATCIRHDTARDIALATVSLNAFADLYLTVLPVLVIGKIQAMNMRTKVGIMATLGLSLFAAVASTCKVWYTHVLYSLDPNAVTQARLYIVMAVEINIVIIVASLPVLAPLVLKPRNNGSSYQTPMLRTYSFNVEDTSKDAMSSIKKPSLILRKSFLSFKQDSVFGSKLSPTIQIEAVDDECRNNSFCVRRTVDIAVESLVPSDGTLEKGIVPESLHDGQSSHHEDNNSPTTPVSWEDLPTPPFLDEKDSYI